MNGSNSPNRILSRIESQSFLKFWLNLNFFRLPFISPFPIFLENQTEFCQTVPLHNKNKKIWKYSENNCLLGFTKIGENENVENLEKLSLLF